MITIYNRTLDITGGDRFIGCRSDNLTEIREFKITDEKLFGMSFKLDTEAGGEKNIFDLTKSASDGCIILKWTITNLHTAQSGVMHVQLRGFDGENCVWRSNTDYFRIGESIYSTEDFTALCPSEFEEIEARVTQFAEECEENASAADGYAESALSSANAASLSRDNAASSEADAENAAKNAEKASASASSSATEAAEWAEKARQWSLKGVTHYYRQVEEEMFAIPSPSQGDICYIISDERPCCQYVYDTNDLDGDSVNPEWIFMGYFSPLPSIMWGMITDKPDFSEVAYTGDYMYLKNTPNRYESFQTITNGIWTYPSADKIILTETNLTHLGGVTNGAIGMIKTEFDLELPENSYKSADYDYLTLTAGQHWLYTFIYDGSHFHWNRTVCG